jgi:anti-sigma factor RsiW
MTHDAWTDRLSEYLDDELDPAERAAADEHLRECAHCRGVLDDLRRVTLRAAALRDTPPAAPLWAGVAERIGHAGLADPGDELAARRARPRPALRWVAGAAAVLALGVGIGRTLPHAPAPGRPVAVRPVAAGDAYRTAAVDHLARSRALLVAFQQRPAADAQASAWADGLLTDTRLLLDSPAADDPRLRRLLQDLELVLVQIAQLGGGEAPRSEAQLARDAIDESGVLPRMRAVVPAAAPLTSGET